MSALLSLRGLTKRFGERLLLDIDELTINVASAYVLTGVNGAGKSTLLRILCGLESAEIHEARFNGEPVAWSPYPRLLRNAVVYVHQHPVMFSTSVPDNIGYGLAARGMPKAIVADKVDEAMAWAGILHLRTSKPTTLSGGEKQRIALARAKVLSPQLLLLDEPASNLDGEAREQVIALIPELIQQGTSLVMACHDRDLIGLDTVQRIKLRDGSAELR